LKYISEAMFDFMLDRFPTTKNMRQPTSMLGFYRFPCYHYSSSYGNFFSK